MDSKISLEDGELIHQLSEDARILEDNFLFRVPRPSVARAVFSPILRRWIAEGLLFRAQNIIAPKVFKFNIEGNSNEIKLCKAGVYEYWMAKTYLMGVGISPRFLAEKYRNRQIEVGNSNFGPISLPQKASIFFGQKIFYWKNEFYTRVDIVKMQANILGGVHFDFKKIHTKEHIREIKNYFGYELQSGNNLQIIHGSDIINARLDADRRPFVYDAIELVMVDTAKIFMEGVLSVLR